MSSLSFPFVMYCELSGEPLSTACASNNGGDNGNNDAIVVTPSGHVCRKRLLLTKLLENGGKDPFVGTNRPLQEDDLITLQPPASTSTSSTTSNVNNMPPKSHPVGGENSNNNNNNNNASTSTTTSLLSFTSTLSRLQTEYDAVLLELFDTRQALTATRRELSLALYQNDAAVRVVSRVSAERDAARQAQIHNNTAPTTAAGQQQQEEEQEQDDQQGATKKRKIETSSVATVSTVATTTLAAAGGGGGDGDGEKILWNDISPTDMASMQAAWEGLHQSRKSLQKQAASLAPSQADLQESFHATALSLSSNKKSSGGILAMTTAVADMNNNNNNNKRDEERIIVTLNGKNQVHLYSVTHQKIVAELETTTGSNSNSRPTAMDHSYFVEDDNRGESRSSASSSSSSSSMVCLAFANGTVQVFRIPKHEPDNVDDNNNKKTKKKATSVVVVTAFGTCEVPTNKTTDDDDAGGPNKNIVDVRFHPDGQHIVAALECGMVALLRYSNNNNNQLRVVSMFDSKNYMHKNDGGGGNDGIKITCGCLHPDGLIYMVGSWTGEVYLWDFRSKTLLAKPLVVVAMEQNSAATAAAAAVQQVIVSPNGYHIAALYGNDGNEKEDNHGIVRIWDLRKQTCLATLNAHDDNDDNDGGGDWLPARCVAFDVSGKYVAYGVSSSSSSGKGKKKSKDSAAAAIHVVAVKEWNQIAASWKLNDKNVNLATPMTGLIWTSPEWLATCSSGSNSKTGNNNLLLIGKHMDKDETMKE